MTGSMLASMIGTGVILMGRLAIAATIVGALLLLATPSTTTATILYWTPAHHLAPQGGIYGTPVACDLDADGDQDVSFVCEGGGRQFWNVGTPQVPAWQMDTKTIPALLGCWERRGTFGDVDADGDFDLISGCMQPGLHMHRNVGTSQVPEWADDSAVVEGVSPDYFAEPCLADMDADGDLDLVIVYKGDPGAFLFRNLGTPQIPQWAHSFSKLPGTTVYAAVRLGDLDLDGDLDIVGRTAAGSVGCWENVGTPQTPTFVENPAMLTGVDGPRDYVRSIALLDIDGDGDLDLLITRGSDDQAFLYLNEGVTGVESTTWGSIKALYR
jgi:hypothetical protein